MEIFIRIDLDIAAKGLSVWGIAMNKVGQDTIFLKLMLEMGADIKKHGN